MNLNEDMAIKEKPNLYEIVANRIEKSILADSSSVGEKFPSEAQIAEKFKVSRNVVREAYKILQERGLLYIRNGDGAYVTRPNKNVLIKDINRFIQMNNAGISELYQVRFILEIAAVGIAVETISEENLAKLADIIGQMEAVCLHDKELWSSLDLDFHNLIVKSTGNELLYAMYKPLAVVLKNIFAQNFLIDGAKEKGLQEHKKVYRCFVNKDAAGAVECMRQHLKASKLDILRFFS
ncbi:MAG: FadR family transcriptional regulator [Eubacteriales bacterium]|nr:FadR family transcriptional regulator [Eubacteriales bacterium]